MTQLAIVAAVTFASFVTVASGQTAPDDRYVKQLAGATLVEGKGFPGVVELGTATPQMYKALGPGREDTNFVFWYFYDRGPWTLVVVADTTPSGEFTTRAIEISGAHAPPTARGIRIGDPIAKVTKTYGASEPFTGSVGSPQFAHATTIDMRDHTKHVLPDVEAAYKAGLYYPLLSLLFVAKDGKVDKIVLVRNLNANPV
jgi:hypothetical protein